MDSNKNERSPLYREVKSSQDFESSVAAWRDRSTEFGGPKSPPKWLSIGGAALTFALFAGGLYDYANNPAPVGYQKPAPAEKNAEDMNVPCAEPTLYTVDWGDTFSGIAYEHFPNMSWEEVAEEDLIDNTSAVTEHRSETAIHQGDELEIKDANCDPDQ